MVDRTLTVMLRPYPELHASSWEAVSTPDLGQRLSVIIRPTMVVAGAQDTSAPSTADQFIVDQIANLRMHTTKGYGHFPPAGAPEQFNTLPRQFLTTA